MTKLIASAPCGLDHCDSPEQTVWKRHRSLLLRLPARDVWRGCLGLAMKVVHPSSGVSCHDRQFVPDAHVRWITLTDLPRGTFRLHFPSRRR